MIDHGIHISGRNQKAEARFAKNLDAFFLFPVRLADDPDFVSPALQQSADDRRTKGRMVHVGIACDIGKIYLFPPSLLHFFFIYW